MSKLVLTNAAVKIGTTDISDYVASVTLTTSSAEVETTSFGSGGAVTRVGGLKDGSLALDIHTGYPTIDALLYPLLGSTVAFEVHPNGTATGTANPKYSGIVLITELTPIAGAVGELATQSVTFPTVGTVTRGTA
jgi:hypothetical protein